MIKMVRFVWIVGRRIYVQFYVASASGLEPLRTGFATNVTLMKSVANMNYKLMYQIKWASVGKYGLELFKSREEAVRVARDGCDYGESFTVRAVRVGI